MAGFLEDTVDTLRQLQKLSKELGPVKTALAALAKRERGNPNPQAAATSLEKVATRVADVSAKYKPSIARMGRLVEHEGPSMILKTAFMAAPAAQIAADVEGFRKKEAARREKVDETTNNRGQRRASLSDSELDEGNDPAPLSPPQQQQPQQQEPGKGNEGGGHSAPASLVAEVCPADTPFLVQPECYQHYHDQLQLRIEMVEYLIDTGRLDTARHVAESYALPLAWFPSLAAEALLAGNTAAGAAGGSGSPSLQSTTHASPVFSSSPLITPATAPRIGGATANGSGCAGMMPTSPMQLPAPEEDRGAPVSPLLAKDAPSRRGPSPPRVSTQAFIDEMPSADTTPISTPTPMPTAVVVGTPAALMQSPKRARAPAAADAGGAGPYSPAWAHSSPSSPPIAANRHGKEAPPSRKRELPDLVVRVVAAGLFLKDEYFDRMVLERLIENGGFTPAWEEDEDDGSGDGDGRRNSRHGPHSASDGTQQIPVVQTAAGGLWRPPHFLPPVRTQLPGSQVPQQSEHPQQNRRASVLEKDLFEEAVVATARRVMRSHICTQSGSAQFDHCMMGVVEELLASALDLHNAKTPSGNTEALPRESAKKSCRRLSPDELLTAEDTFSSDILFVKRPTRYHCVHTNRIMDGSGEGGTFPRALPNGMVIADSAVAGELSDVRVTMAEGGKAIPRMEIGVVCPPSQTFFTQRQLKRIFVT